MNPLSKRAFKRGLLFCVIILSFLAIQYFLYQSNLLELPEKNLFLFLALQLDFLLLLFLLYLIFRYLYKIFWNIRGKKISKSLKFKLLLVYALSIGFTAFVLILGSFLFLKEGLDYWLEEFSALRISSQLLQREDILKETEADLLKKALQIKENYLEKTESIKSKDLRERYRYFLGLDSIEIYTLQGELYKKTYSDEVTERPGIPPTLITELLREKKSQSSLQTLGSKLLLRVFLPFQPKQGETLILAVGKVIEPNKLKEFAQKEKRLSKSLQVFLLFSIALIFLLVLFLGIWVGNKLGKSLTEPLQTLVLATQKLSHRDFRLDDLLVETSQEDELAQLMTAIKKMAEEIKRYETTLRKYNEYLKGVLNALPVGILILKEKGEPLFVNEQLHKILKEYHYQDPLEFYTELHLDEPFQELEVEQSFYRVYTLTREGRELFLGVTFMKLDLFNELLKLMIIEDLEEKEALKRLSLWKEVAVRIAHEIKNPLTPIKLSVERLKRRLSEDLPEEKREILEKTITLVNRYVEELRKLAYDLYYFSKRPVFEKREVNLQGNIEEVLELYLSAYPEVEIRFEVNLEEEPLLQADPFQLKRVWINLLENSLKAMGEKGAILLSLYAEGERLKVSYEDSGPGLKEELMEALNQEEMGELQKIGTGLMIMTSIVKLLGGSLRVEKRKEGGSRFLLEFPWKKEAS